MVAMVRRGIALRAVARRLQVSLHTVQRWVARAADQRLNRVDWADRPPIAHIVHRIPPETEVQVLRLRRELKEVSDLGEFGARAIHQTLLARGERYIPSIRTIGRILERYGTVDYRRRRRRPAPPRGWHLPDVAAGRAELDSFDIVEGLLLPDKTEIEVLTGTSLHGGIVSAWPGPPLTARQIAPLLISHWREVGLPSYAQFDNDNRFQGPHHHVDAIGRVTRLCLSLGVVPVFAPPREPGFQNALENFNGRWQAKVWARFAPATLAELAACSARYITASRQRAAARSEHAPPRSPVPPGWQLDLQAPLHGQIIFLRRTGEYGTVSLLGRTFLVDPLWCHRLVRCEFTLHAGCLRFYGLRRAQPDAQPLLRETSHTLPKRRFKE